MYIMSQTIKSDTLARIVAAFVIILGLFFVIEILPLHFGEKQIPWHELPAEIKTRLPRILAIAAIASAYIGTAKRARKEE